MTRMLGQILLAVALAYAAVLVLVYLFQSRLVYFPEVGRGVAATPLAYGLRFEPVAITTEDNERLAGWWVPVENAAGAVLFFHGNAGNISHRLDYLAMFNRLNYSTLIVDYRGYGESTGSPSEEGTYRDAQASWDYLRHARAARSDDIVVVGESLGAAVAAWLAARERPRAVVLASTFTSIPDLGSQVYPFLPVRFLSRFSYDNLAAVRKIRAPIFVAHSPGDDIIPYAHGRALHAAASEPKEFLDLSGGHNDGFLFVRQEWVAALGAFLDRAAARSRKSVE